MYSYTEEQHDALVEIVNIGMGRAGESLARLLDRFVRLPVPRVQLVDAQKVIGAVERMLEGGTTVTAVRQAFSSGVAGEAVVLFGETSYQDLADIVGDGGDATGEQELLLDVGNVLIGACLGGIGEQLGYDFVFSAPSLLADRKPLAEALGSRGIPWRYALLVEVNFRLEGKSFVCHVLVFWPEEALAELGVAIDRFLEALS